VTWSTAPSTKITNFGVFVGLEDGLEGLLHISELSEDMVENAEDVGEGGRQGGGRRCSALDTDERKIGLSKKRVGWSAEREAAEASSRSLIHLPIGKATALPGLASLAPAIACTGRCRSAAGAWPLIPATGWMPQVTAANQPMPIRWCRRWSHGGIPAAGSLRRPPGSMMSNARQAYRPPTPPCDRRPRNSRRSMAVRPPSAGRRRRRASPGAGFTIVSAVGNGASGAVEGGATAGRAGLPGSRPQQRPPGLPR